MAWRRSVFVLIAALLMAGCVAESGLPGTVISNPATAPVRVDPAAAARMVSAVRVDNGLSGVSADAALNAIAQRYADRMAAAGVVSHELGGSFQQRMGSGYVAAAENIGGGYRSLDEAMAYWIASPGHFANLVTPGVTRIGIASGFNAASPYRTFWVLVLAEPR